MRAFLGKITEVLRSWVPDAVGELKSTKSYVMVVPWEVQLSGTQLTKPKDLERLSKILAFLDPHVVKIFRPPQILFHLLPQNIHVLHVSCNPHDEPLDFSPLENVETLRFGKKLYRLVLDGPVVTDGKETEEEGDEVEELPGMFDPEDLEAIGELNGITDFRIGTFFPLSDYTGIIPTINKLKALKTLSVRGLSYFNQQAI
ncbi:hypothetical protein BC829DRAFT_30129 [Chytridium lagenaria]|nr:hypothetical protein BC829DRAFT_30129 [Chytridium lagenaria]